VPEGTCSVDGCSRPIASREWCVAHYKRWSRYGDPLGGGPSQIRGTLAERFWPKVDKDGPIPTYRPDLGRCWLWTGSGNGRGYGQIGEGNRNLYAHRVAYELAIGPIPIGKQIDHLCRVRNCVNPAHLEAVTQKENVERGTTGEVNAARQLAQTHCKRGHPFDAANTYIAPNGQRLCKTCRRWRARRKTSS
jgi:hypothetical protein